METRYPFYVKAATILLSIALGIGFLIAAKPILVPLLIAVFIAILFMQPCSVLERYKIPRVWSAAIIVILSFCILAGLVTLFVNQVRTFSQDLDMMEERLNDLIAQAKDFIESITGSEPMQGVNNVQDILNTVAKENGSYITSGAFSVLGKLIWLVLTPIFIFLLLIYRSFLKEFLVRAIAGKDPAKSTNVQMLVDHVKRVVQGYISGVFIIMIILSVCFYIILTLFGIDHAIFFAVFAGFLSIIPYVGLIIGSAFPAFYALITRDSLWYPVGIFCSFQLFVFIEGNLLKPYIIGHKVSMNPLITILAIFIGDMIWGVAGMILIIPTVAIMKEIFEQVDALKPYAFLIGNISTETDEKPGFVKKQMKKIEKKLPAKKRTRL